MPSDHKRVGHKQTHVYEAVALLVSDKSGRGITPAELSEKLQCANSTARRILTNLHEEGAAYIAAYRKVYGASGPYSTAYALGKGHDAEVPEGMARWLINQRHRDSERAKSGKVKLGMFGI